MEPTLETVRSGLRCLSEDAEVRFRSRGYAFALHSSSLSVHWEGTPCVYLTTSGGASVPVSWEMLTEATSIFYFVGIPAMKTVLFGHPLEAGSQAPMTMVRVLGRATPPDGQGSYDFEWWVSATGETPALFWTHKRPVGWPP